MLTPFIVNFNGSDADSKSRTLKIMDNISFNGVFLKAGTDFAYMFCNGHPSKHDIGETLQIDESRIIDASGWDMVSWSSGS